jgi:hypothetical protein
VASKGGLRKGFSLASLVALSPEHRKLLGVEAVAIVRDRAFPKTGAGRDEHDRPYTPYSTKRLYVAKKSPPRPADMPAPRGLTARGRATATKKGTLGDQGRTAKELKTVRYDGGYSQYRASIGRSSGAAKNLVLTGKTAQAMAVLESSAERILIGFTNRRERAIVLDEGYHFMGLTDGERTRLQERMTELVLDQIRAGR